jgi:hypothetical protein
MGVRIGAPLGGRDDGFAGDIRSAVEAVPPSPTGSGMRIVGEALAAEAQLERHGIEGSAAL